MPGDDPDDDPGDRLDPDALAEMLADVGESVIVGFVPTPEHLDLRIQSLVGDERGAAPALFGFRAPRRWAALGVAMCGRARRLDAAERLDGEAVASIVVDRHARVASTLRIDGERVDDPPTPGEPLHPLLSASVGRRGLVEDALHRCLGLASPGSPPPMECLAMAIWATEVLGHLGDGGGTTWPELLALHPGELGGWSSKGGLQPSVESVVEATRRVGHDADWSRMRRRAASGVAPSPLLAPDDVAWMDATMYGRWVLSSLASPFDVHDQLVRRRQHRAAASWRGVVDAVGASLSGRGEPDVTAA